MTLGGSVLWQYCGTSDYGLRIWLTAWYPVSGFPASSPAKLLKLLPLRGFLSDTTRMQEKHFNFKNFLGGMSIGPLSGGSKQLFKISPSPSYKILDPPLTAWLIRFNATLELSALTLTTQILCFLLFELRVFLLLVIGTLTRLHSQPMEWSALSKRKHSLFMSLSFVTPAGSSKKDV